MKLFDKIDFVKLGEKKLFRNMKITPKAIRNILNVIVCVAVVGAIIAANIAISAVTEKYPINLDLTSDGDYSATTLYDEENKEILDFIKGIQNKIDITVCINELDTSNGIYQTYMENLYSMTDKTSGKYYEQMKALAASFPKINQNITLTYQSTLEPAFAAISARFPDKEIKYGDILVESTFKNSSGVEVTRQKILNVADIYETKDESGYAEMGMDYYYIVGSNLEQQLTQALYYVTSEKSNYVAYLSGHGCQKPTALQELLEGNNYEFIEVEDLLAGVDEKCEFLIINAPTADFTNEEIGEIEKFLKPNKEGLQQKTLLYVLDAIAQLPVYNDFLQEWGFEVYDELVYSDVSSNYYMSYINVQPKISTDNNNYLPDVSASKKVGFGGFRAFKITDGQRNASLLNFPEGYVGVPISEMKEDSDWTKDKATVTGQLEALSVSVRQEAFGDGMSPTIMTSNVVVAGSTDLFSSNILKSSAYMNGSFTVGLFNKLATLNTNSVKQIEFVPKEIKTDSFAEQLEGTSAAKTVMLLFAIPAVMMIIGIVVYVRRRRR